MARVGREPLRKLSSTDRLVKPMMTAREYGLPCDKLLLGIGAALHYNNPEDPQSVKMQELIAAKGLRQAVSEITSIPATDPVIEEIAAATAEVEKQIREVGCNAMKRPFIAVTALTLATAISFTSVAEERPASEKRLHTVQINSLEDLKAYFRYDPERDIIVSGHRGGMMPGYPENCIESCEKTLSMMPTFFEIDFSFTKDSVMVLMHDLTIDRTTDGKGRVADYTYEELQGFRLVDRDGKLTPYRMPRLKDMLEWGKDKVVFNFDNKYINTKGVSDEVRKASLDYYIRQLRPGGDWSMYHNIMLSVRSLDEAMYYWNAGIRNVMFCCEISTREMFDAYTACPIPWDYIMAYIRLSVDPRLQEVYDLLHERGVSTMTSITGSSDKVKNPRDRRVCYLRDLVSEPDLIETDYPSEFVDLPRSRAEIHALQDRAIEGNRSVKADKAKKNRRK